MASARCCSVCPREASDSCSWACRYRCSCGRVRISYTRGACENCPPQPTRSPAPSPHGTASRRPERRASWARAPAYSSRTPGRAPLQYRARQSAAEAETELGQSARVFIENPSQSALAGPLAEVSAEAGQSFVWVVESESHRLRRQPVQVGNYQPDRATILQGLKAGDWIVAAGVHMLLEGQQVLPVDRQNRSVQIAGE